MPLSRWFIANLRLLVTQFRVHMCFQLTINRPIYRWFVILSIYLYDLFPSIIFNRVNIHPITYFLKAFSGNYKPFDTWKVRQKIPPVMISRQNGEIKIITGTSKPWYISSICITFLMMIVLRYIWFPLFLSFLI